MRKWFGILAVILCLTLPLTALAVTVDYAQTGTLQVQLETTSARSDWSGVEISLYRIGEVENPNEDLCYRVSGEFADCAVDLNYTSAHEADSAAKAIGKYIENRQLQPMAKQRTDAKGLAVFDGLSVGVYYAEKSGGTKEIDIIPFIVTIPYYKNGELLYTVPVNPKMEIRPQPTLTPQPTTPPDDNKLPQTGVTRWPVVALSIGGCVLIALGAGLILAARRKREKQ